MSRTTGLSTQLSLAPDPLLPSNRTPISRLGNLHERIDNGRAGRPGQFLGSGLCPFLNKCYSCRESSPAATGGEKPRPALEGPLRAASIPFLTVSDPQPPGTSTGAGRRPGAHHGPCREGAASARGGWRPDKGADSPGRADTNPAPIPASRAPEARHAAWTPPAPTAIVLWLRQGHNCSPGGPKAHARPTCSSLRTRAAFPRGSQQV